MTPEPNDPNQQKDFIADYANELRQIEIEGYELAVKKARNALFWAGCLYFFWEMVGMFTAGGGFSLVWLVIALVEAGIFIGPPFGLKQNPILRF